MKLFKTWTPKNSLVFTILVILILTINFSLSKPILAQETPKTPYPVPALLSPANDSLTTNPEILIKGLAKNDSLIKVFIDNKLNGQFKVKNHPSETANFAYEPFLNLKPGRHSVYVTATDKKGRQSGHSNTLTFKVELPFPAPTLSKTVVNEQTTANKPFIIGLAKNDSLIKVFIDNKLNGQFWVTNNDSGTANFAYKPFWDLKEETHSVYTTATDKKGKQSVRSNTLTFEVKIPKVLAQEAPPIQTSPQEEILEEETPPAEELLSPAPLEEAFEEGEKEGEEGKTDYSFIWWIIILAFLVIIIIIRARSRSTSREKPSRPEKSSPPSEERTSDVQRTPDVQNKTQESLFEETKKEPEEKPREESKEKSEESEKDKFPPPPPPVT